MACNTLRVQLIATSCSKRATTTHRRIFSSGAFLKFQFLDDVLLLEVAVSPHNATLPSSGFGKVERSSAERLP